MPSVILRPEQPWGNVVQLGNKTYPGPLNRRRAGPVGGRLTFSTATTAWLEAVEATDIANGAVGPMSDGIWNAKGPVGEYFIPRTDVGAHFDGARTLAGALVPFKGPTPTGVNLVSDDFNGRLIQLNGTTKYINFNYNNSDLSESNCHYLVSVAADYSYPAAIRFLGGSNATMGTGVRIDGSSNRFEVRLANNTLEIVTTLSGVLISGLYGASRTGTGTTRFLYNDVVTTAAALAPGASSSHALTLGARFDGAFAAAIAPNFYSAGPDIDLVEANNMIKATTAAITAALA